MRPYNRGTRTRLPDGDVDLDAPPTPDRRVTRKLVQNGYVDVAWHLYQHTHDQALLERTGSDDRVDHAYVSQPLAQAVSDYRRLTNPDGASDHHGLTFHLDPAAADTSNVWIHR
jgi:exonuclease III